MALQPEILRQPIKQVKRARALRKEMSLPAVLLWIELQKRPGGHRFRREVPQKPYTLDFACLKARLAIEVDGEAHSMGDRPALDEMRDGVMTERGFQTIRLPAYEVLNNIEGCVLSIVAACDERAEPSPPRNGEVARSDGGVPPCGERNAGSRGGPLRPFGAPPRSGEDFS